MGTVGEIFRAVLSYNHPNGSVMQNVFTWQLVDGDESDGDVLTSLDSWVDTNWVPNWEAGADNTVTLFLMEVDVLNGDGTVKRNIGEEIHGDDGLIADEAMASGVAGFFQFDTERTKSLGRKYVPGIAESRVGDGVLDPTMLGLMGGMLVNAVVDIVIGGGGTLEAGVLSKVLSDFIKATGSGYITDIPAYQRRRKENVGS